MNTHVRPANAEVAVIVDGYSSGIYLAPELKRRGLACVHVRSSETIGLSLGQAAGDDYLETIQWNGDIEAVLQALAPYRVHCVLPGIEGAGIAIADQLSDRLGVPGNDPLTSSARQNKADMQQALADAGVRHIPFARVSTQEQLVAACEAFDSWPLVVKPLTSGNTEDVIICPDLDRATSALAEIVGKRNSTEQLNTAVIVETFIDGDEYVVNTVSRDGEHYITDMWAYDKRLVIGATRVCLKMRLLPPHGEVQDALRSYIGPALDALGVRNGAAHSEVFITADGPVLGETGARLMGGGLPPEIFEEALGYTQTRALIDSVVDESAWRSHSASDYRQLRSLEVVNLMMDRPGTVVSMPGLPTVRELPSFRLEMMAVSPGDQVYPTVDGWTCPGHFVLSSPSADQVASDYAAIRALEPTFFELAPST